MTDQPAPVLQPEILTALIDKYLPSLRELRGKPIEYVGGGKEPDGTIRLAYPATPPVVYAFIEACHRASIIYPFEWSRFVERAKALLLPGGIEAATLGSSIFCHVPARGSAVPLDHARVGRNALVQRCSTASLRAPGVG